MVSNTRSVYVTSAILAVFVLIFFSSALIGQAVSPVEIKFWHAMGRSRGKVLTELVERFNKENPDIIVKAEYVKSANEQYGNDYNALYSKILENIAKDTPPDVAQVYENWTTQYIGIDCLVPIQDLMSPEDLQNVKDLVPAFLEANTFVDDNGDKKLYTLPFNKSIYVLFYNDKIFKELGLNPPTTWNELRNVAKIISTKKGIPGLAFQPSVDIFGHYLYSYGGTYIKDNKAVFGGKLGIDDLNYWGDLVHKDMSAKPTFEAAKMFEKGQAAMYIETTSKIGGFEKARKEGLSFGVLPIPKGTTQSYQFAGTNLAIFKGGSPEKQKAAYRFISYMSSPRITEEWAIKTGYLPVRTSAIRSNGYQSFINQHAEYKVGVQSLAKATVQPRIPVWESIRSVIDDAMFKSLGRKYDAETALREAVDTSDKLLYYVSGDVK